MTTAHPSARGARTGPVGLGARVVARLARVVERGPGMLTVTLATLLAPGCADDAGPVDDRELRALIAAAGTTALPEPTPPDPALYELGRALFFDPELSGNRDIACATCHSPELATTDFVSLAIGTGGRGIGPNRVLPEGRRLDPRNTLDLFNRGFDEWTALGWDGEVSPRADGGWTEPEDWEDTRLPDGLSTALAAYAIVAVSDRDQMAGRRGDVAVDGEPNELGGLEDEELPELWRRLVARLTAIEEYRTLFAAAFPEGISDGPDGAFPKVVSNTLDITHVAEALAAFQASAFVSVGSPFDIYLAGDDAALDEEAKRGALLFFGRAGCADCHGGPHLTGHGYHALAVPQVGLGQEDEEPMDYGRGRETNVPEDRFRFRAPPLRNVTETGPWMHDGAYTTLEAAVRHHLDCEGSLRAYDPRQLKPELQFSFRDSPIELQRILANADPWCDAPRRLDRRDLDDLLAFLDALTDPGLPGLAERLHRTPPSGRDPR